MTQMHQDTGSLDCGPVCVQMILKYFGLEKDIILLKENLKYNENGTSIYDNGLVLMNAGLTVTAITAQPYLFPPDLNFNSKDSIFLRIQERSEKLTKYKEGLDVMVNFLQKGGGIKVEIPKFVHIKNAIDNGNPVLALVYAQALGSKEGGFHFVVVNGYNDEQVHITNPSKIATSGWYPVEHFFYALHTSTTYDIDNGTLLVISK